ncbi:MAG: RecX family transcriptional regulator [Bacteroidales bacterium]|nr:RecX family transcriptional regulator [Bacteroidales bacterium]
MMDTEKALTKMMHTCSRVEKCANDIRDKLRKWELTEAQIEVIIKELYQHKFIDDDRFAKAFTRDKSRFNSWGKIKIRYHLRAKGISPEVITEALTEINDEDYHERLEKILKAKIQSMQQSDDPYKAKAKLIRLAAGKGYEQDLIYKTINHLQKESPAP